jgi:hypothetical protein
VLTYVSQRCQGLGLSGRCNHPQPFLTYSNLRFIFL